jgi:hypothetical protein
MSLNHVMDPEDRGDSSSSSLAQPLLNNDDALLSSFPRHSHSRDASSVGGSVEIANVDEGTDNNDRRLLGFKGQGIPTIVIIVIPLLVLLGVLFLAAVLVPQKNTVKTPSSNSNSTLPPLR